MNPFHDFMKTPAFHPGGVIFDVDGVLVDSYDAHLKSWRIVAADDGVRFTEEDFATTFGQTSREIIRRFWPPAGLSDERIRAIDERKERLFREIVAADFPAMPGAREVIDRLRTRGFRIALGSSGPAPNVRLAVDRLHLAELVDAVVTGDDVKRGKPDPEVFLFAASMIGLDAARCVVIEDAPAGVQAARAAGMPVICLLSRGHRREHYAATMPTRFINELRKVDTDLVREVAATRD